MQSSDAGLMPVTGVMAYGTGWSWSAYARDMAAGSNESHRRREAPAFQLARIVWLASI